MMIQKQKIQPFMHYSRKVLFIFHFGQQCQPWRKSWTALKKQSYSDLLQSKLCTVNVRTGEGRMQTKDTGTNFLDVTGQDKGLKFTMITEAPWQISKLSITTTGMYNTSHKRNRKNVTALICCLIQSSTTNPPSPFCIYNISNANQLYSGTAYIPSLHPDTYIKHLSVFLKTGSMFWLYFYLKKKVVYIPQ